MPPDPTRMRVSDDDLRMLFDSVLEVVSVECASSRLHAFFDGEGGLEQDLWTRAVELGWLGVGVPETAGGLGFGPQGMGVLLRALGRCAAPGPFMSTLVAAQWLSEAGPPELQQTLLPKFAAGELAVAIPAASAASGASVVAGRISGTSEPLLTSPLASLAIVRVQQDGNGVFALVEPDQASQPEAPAQWDRTRHVASLDLNGATLIALIDDPQGRCGRALARHTALAVASDSVGGARRIAEQTIDYMKVREQFGRPIASFQALKHRAADLMTAIVSAEQLVEHALEAAADDDPSADMWACLAKATASESYQFVADDCLQLHGGVGFTWEFDCHIFLKRALLNRALGDDNRALRDRAETYLRQAALAARSPAELGS